MKESVVLFGASEQGQAAYLLLKNQYNIMFFCDNDQNKWGKEFCGLRIISPQELNSVRDAIVIITSSYFKEISQQLLDMGIDYFRVFSYSTSNNFQRNIQRSRPKMELLGSDYGGYTICPDGITEQSIVYSFGIGKDISFDKALIDRFSLSVFAFDPTPRSVSWVKQQPLPEKFHFLEYAISDFDGQEEFYPPDDECYDSFTVLKGQYKNNNSVKVPVLTLKTIMDKLQHKKIDIIKMDIEGSEYKVIKNIIDTGISFNQLLVEFHHRFPGISLKETKGAIDLLKSKGYELFYVSNEDSEFSFVKCAK